MVCVGTTKTHKNFDALHEVLFYCISDKKNPLFRKEYIVQKILQIQPQWAIMLSNCDQNHIRYMFFYKKVMEAIKNNINVEYPSIIKTNTD